MTVAAVRGQTGKQPGEGLGKAIRKSRALVGAQGGGEQEGCTPGRTKAVHKWAKVEFIRPFLVEQTFH